MLALRVTVLTLLVSGVAFAETDPKQAETVAREAEQLAAKGAYDDAAAKFRAAHRLDPRPEYLCNVGVAYQRAQQLQKAQMYLGECLLRGTSLDGKLVDLFRRAQGVVEDKLRTGEFGPFDLSVDPPGASFTLDGFAPDEYFVGSRVLWLPFGKHALTVSAEGFISQTREIEVTTRIPQKARIELQVKPADKPKLTTTTTTVGRSRVPAIAASVATVGLIVGAIASNLHARTIMDGARVRDIDQSTYDDIVGRAETWERASWGLTGLAALGAAASIYFWTRADARVEVKTQSQGAAVSVSGRW